MSGEFWSHSITNSTQQRLDMTKVERMTASYPNGNRADQPGMNFGSRNTQNDIKAMK